MEEDGYKIIRFSSLTMDSEYNCYKIEFDSKCLVLKITNKVEVEALELLKRNQIQVPSIYEIMYASCSEDKVALFEEYLSGNELSHNSPIKDWMDVAKQLANMHTKLWDLQIPFTNIISEELYNKKVSDVLTSNYFRNNYEDILKIVRERLNIVPKIISHGDAFPTNFLVDNSEVSIIDLADVCVSPYFFDIARFTSIPNKESGVLFCPDPEQVLKEYYKVIQRKLSFAENIFLKDVYIGSFIEVAFLYTQIIRSPFDIEYRTLLEHFFNQYAEKIRSYL
ncbi:phosphotransferase [Elizabethkingia meningoseptica]